MLSLDGDGTTLVDAAPLDAATAAELAARAGVQPPYLLTQNVSPGQRYRLSGPIWTESFADDALFSADPAAAATSVRQLGFVSVDLDFSGYENALWPRLAVASGILLLLLGVSWACGRWFLKSALAPLSELEHSLGAARRRSAGGPLPELAVHGAARDRDGPRGHDARAAKARAPAAASRESRSAHGARRTAIGSSPSSIASSRAAPTSGARSALFFIDLDQFKYVNDTCGHAAGDHLLQLAAQQLRYAVRAEDFVARFGGDEFVVLVRNVSRNEARAAATKVLELMRGLKHVEREQVFHLQCSIGVTLLHGDRLSSHEVIAQADIACRSAKAHGRNRVEIYSPAGKQSEQIAKDVLTMNRLREALEADRFELLYQPLMHVKTRTVSHYETLLRLPIEDGVLGPESFLPAAFRFGLMADIDRWVLRRVVRSLAELTPSMPRAQAVDEPIGLRIRGRGARGVPARAVDGARRLRRPARPRDHRAARGALCREHGQADHDAARSRLPARDRRFRQRLQLVQLSEAPARRLPEDRRLVHQESARDRVDQAMVRMVGEVARAAGIETVAEYVHSAATLELLAKYGIDYAQGYFIGKPMAQPMASNVTPIAQTREPREPTRHATL